MKRLRPLLLLLAALLTGSASTLAGTPETAALLAKARARLGGDAALAAVNSLHFFGSIEMTETPAGEQSLGKSSIEIIFQKPTQHRLVVSSPKAIDITGLDDYSAWRRVEPGATAATADNNNARRPKTTPLNTEQTKRLRANTWENLFFYQGIEQRGGQVIDGCEAEIEGVKCRKITFSYGPKIDFVRYFELTTGRLVLTETFPVGTIREEGEIVVDGVRFPQRLIATGTAGPDGKVRVITITFDRIALNETFPASTFEQPLGIAK